MCLKSVAHMSPPWQLSSVGRSPLLGDARTVALPGAGWNGARAALRETVHAIIRPYWLVKNIQQTLQAVEKAGGFIAHPPLEVPSQGRFAIYIQGETQHGLWQI